MPGCSESQISRANALFKQVLAPDRMQAAARSSRFVQRQRVVDASDIFWALMVTLGGQSTQYISDVLRTLNSQRGLSLRYKPFWNRLAKPAFVRFMRDTFQQLCSDLVVSVLKQDRDRAFFSDILMDDGTSFGLADGLQKVFPGRFTALKPAAVELHAQMSLFRDQVLSVKLSPDKEGERQFLPEPDQLPRRSLSLRDRGYLDLDYFQKLQELGNEAYVICRSRKSINPVVLQVRGVARSLAKRWKGKHLADIPLTKLKDSAEFLVAFERKDATVELRLVLQKIPPNPRRGPKRPFKKRPAPSATWMYLLTNLPRDRFGARDVLRLYRLRWQIELAFKDWKSYSNLRALQTENPAIVEGLIWAALCAAFLKRALAHWTQLVHRRPISTRISAQCGPQILPMLVDWATHRTLATKLAQVFAYLAVNALRRAHPKRDKKRPQQELGFAFAYS